MDGQFLQTKFKFLSSTIALRQWEWINVPVLRTLVGQHVYFSIANELLAKPNEPEVRSLKNILNHQDFTDRAIRLKLREMERMGLISSVNCGIDKRVRNVLPTPRLEQLFEKHSKFIKSLLEKEYILLEK
jgi:hypothetical protein